MESLDRKKHWETLYASKAPNEVSWTQAVPTTSLEIIRSFDLDKTVKVIDVGGGDSTLVDYLLEEGYENITVLDISAKAIERAKKRLGKIADKVNWIVSDIIEFDPSTTYDLWHDRAVFHFLTTPEEISKYVHIVRQSVSEHLIIATFSENGPKKCCGLDIKQYSQKELVQAFKHGFEKVHCQLEDHVTPFGTSQNFLFCSFKRHGDMHIM